MKKAAKKTTKKQAKPKVPPPAKLGPKTVSALDAIIQMNEQGFTHMWVRPTFADPVIDLFRQIEDWKWEECRIKFADGKWQVVPLSEDYNWWTNLPTYPGMVRLT